jgi:hypothetical protein
MTGSNRSRLNIVSRLLTLFLVSVITILLSRGAFASHGASGSLSWQTNCKESLDRAEEALTNPARPTQIAQRVRELPSAYQTAPTRDLVRFLVSYWSSRDDLQQAFSNDAGDLDIAAAVNWARDGVDSTAVALVPCATALDKLPGTASSQSAVPEILRWARNRLRWQREVDDAAFAAADFIRSDRALVKASRANPALAILAAASVPLEDPRYQALWKYQAMFDLLLRAEP